MLCEKRGGHKPTPADDADFSAAGKDNRSGPMNYMNQHEGQQHTGDERGDPAKNLVLRFFAFSVTDQLHPGFLENQAIPNSTQQPLGKRGNQDQAPKMMNLHW